MRLPCTSKSSRACVSVLFFLFSLMSQLSPRRVSLSLCLSGHDVDRLAGVVVCVRPIAAMSTFFRRRVSGRPRLLQRRAGLPPTLACDRLLGERQNRPVDLRGSVKLFFGIGWNVDAAGLCMWKPQCVARPRDERIACKSLATAEQN